MLKAAVAAARAAAGGAAAAPPPELLAKLLEALAGAFAGGEIGFARLFANIHMHMCVIFTQHHTAHHTTPPRLNVCVCTNVFLTPACCLFPPLPPHHQVTRVLRSARCVWAHWREPASPAVDTSSAGGELFVVMLTIEDMVGSRHVIGCRTQDKSAYDVSGLVCSFEPPVCLVYPGTRSPCCRGTVQVH